VAFAALASSTARPIALPVAGSLGWRKRFVAFFPSPSTSSISLARNTASTIRCGASSALKSPTSAASVSVKSIWTRGKRFLLLRADAAMPLEKG